MEKRNTEYFVRELLIEKGYRHPNKVTDINDPVFEEQQSTKQAIATRLAIRSKKGTGEKGSPEFILSKHSDDIVIIIECKKEISRLKSNDFTKQENVQNYAVDGAIWYGKALSDIFNVFCIGVAGTEEDKLDIETYFIPKGTNEPHYFNSSILHFHDYEVALKEEELREEIDEEELKKLADDLNDLMRDEFKLGDQQKPLLVSSIFLALKDASFRASYKLMKNSSTLANFIESTIIRMLSENETQQIKIDALISEYSFLKTTPHLKSVKLWDTNDIRPNTAPLLFMIKELENKCFKFIENNETTLDIIGLFYSKFLKYTSSDGKSLGVVLTPQHITELFCNLANDGRGLNPEKDIILDICAGTGGFLVNAMHQMVVKSKNNLDLIEDIKKKRIRGIESKNNMFALLSANMIVRGDGKSGIQFGSCFDKKIIQEVRKDGIPTVGLMNPPYSQKKSDESEYHFILQLLDSLDVGGSGVVIVPISIATALGKQDIEYKKAILKKHTLKAVMKLNVYLFGENASTHTCIMVFEAHKAHDKETTPVWLANWSDDGFEVLKHRGRVMIKDWKAIQNQWLKDYRTKVVRDNYSTIINLDENDEWIIDAHVDTDYSNLSSKMFTKAIRDFYAFKIQYPQLFKEGK